MDKFNIEIFRYFPILVYFNPPNPILPFQFTQFNPPNPIHPIKSSQSNPSNSILPIQSTQFNPPNSILPIQSTPIQSTQFNPPNPILPIKSSQSNPPNPILPIQSTQSNPPNSIHPIQYLKYDYSKNTDNTATPRSVSPIFNIQHKVHKYTSISFKVLVENPRGINYKRRAIDNNEPSLTADTGRRGIVVLNRSGPDANYTQISFANMLLLTRQW